MGFHIATKAALVLTGNAWKGAEVICRLNVPIGTVLDAKFPPDQESLTEWFGNVVESWNLEDEGGKPLPCTAENFAQLPTGFRLRLYSTWMDVATGMASPLGQRSPNGVPVP